MSLCHKTILRLLSLAAALTLVCSGTFAWGQGDFAFPSSGSLSSPQSPRLESSQPILTRPDASWPDQPVRYDDFVQQANVEQQADSGQGVADLIGSTVDSAGQLLGSWKQKIGQQTDQLMTGSDASASSDAGWLGAIQQKVASPDARRMLGSLALVIGGYLALVVVLRKFGVGGSKEIPSEVVEVMGRLPYGPKQNLQLIRLGSKLLLLINGPDGTHPVGEITDAGEVEYLSAMCQGKRAIRPGASPARARSAEPGARAVTEDRLSQVLRRLEQATGGGTANFEA